MINILIANNGLSAFKFIISVREWAISNHEDIRFIGFGCKADLDAKYKYLDNLHRIFYYGEDGIPYNNIEYIVGIAEQCAKEYADEIFMVWPGWGFLSENDVFVSELEKRNITFVGPSSKTIRVLGDKIEAAELTERIKLNVPKTATVLYNDDGSMANETEMLEFCDEVGYPVLVKYSGGGGGRGQRPVYQASEMWRAIDDVGIEVQPGLSSSERATNLKDKVFIMKYLPDCFHLEVQFICDGETFSHMLGRDCSVQRRKQKLLEEAPIPGISDETMQRMIDDTRKIVINDVCKYKGVGTAEFLLDRKTGETYFLEVNPRLQVEHIISEHLFNANLPAIQVQIALGKKLSEINLGERKNQHVIAARINSENVFKDFQASVGRVGNISFTPYTCGYFSINNDSLISSLSDGQIGHIFAVGETREIAAARLARSLKDLVVDGCIFNTAQLLRYIVQHDDFLNRNYNTVWLEHLMKQKVSLIDTMVPIDTMHPTLCALYRTWKHQSQLWENHDNMKKRGHQVDDKQLKPSVNLDILYRDILYKFKALCVPKENHIVLYQNGQPYMFRIEPSGKDLFVFFEEKLYRLQVLQDDKMGIRMDINRMTAWFPVAIDDSKLISEFSGRMTKIVNEGTTVKKGDVLCQIEVMKMLTDIVSKVNGVIHFKIDEGMVQTGDLIAELDLETDATIEESKQKEFSGRLLTRCGGSQENIRELCDRIVPKVEHREKTNTELSKESRVEIVFKSTYIYKLISYFTEMPNIVAKELVNKDGTLQYTDRDSGTNDIGMVGWELTYDDGKVFYIVANDITKNYGSFNVPEDTFYTMMCCLARENKVPLVYISCNSGANIAIKKDLLADIQMEMDEESKEWFLYLTEETVATHLQYVGVDRILKTDKGNKYVLNWVKNDVTSADVLNGSGEIAAETVRTYRDTMILTYVTGRSVGIGAYVSRMSGRIIQKHMSPLLLTGFRALNDLLGTKLYLSDNQLGGTNIMHKNGITDMTVATDKDGVNAIMKWLRHYNNGAPVMTNVPKELSVIQPGYSSRSLIGQVLDNGSFMETLSQWAKSVVTGRGTVNGRSIGIIMGETDTTEKVIPADPGNPDSSSTTVLHSGLVMFPDTSKKIARTIRDVRLEKLPLLVIANWRGFSGGTRDMFEEVLTYGSQIVEELVSYDQPVTVWIPPHAQLRGGAFIVWSPLINKKCIKMFMSNSARVGVLEPTALKNVKIKMDRKYGTSDKVLEEQFAHVDAKVRDSMMIKFCDMHDKAESNSVEVKEVQDIREHLSSVTM